MIISARHGLIRHTHPIDPYDEELPQAHNLELSNRIATQFTDLLPSKLNRVLILAPKRYVAYLPIEEIFFRAVEAKDFTGRLGTCQACLLQWLGIDYSKQTRKPTALGPLSEFTEKFDADKIQEQANQLLAKTKTPNHVIQWYALVGSEQIPVKRLVSALTGEPVTSFETCHALALLERNGVRTCRVGV